MDGRRSGTRDGLVCVCWANASTPLQRVNSARNSVAKCNSTKQSLHGTALYSSFFTAEQTRSAFALGVQPWCTIGWHRRCGVQNSLRKERQRTGRWVARRSPCACARIAPSNGA